MKSRFKALLFATLSIVIMFSAALSMFGCNSQSASAIDTLIVGTTSTVDKPTPADDNYDRFSATLSRLAPVSLTGDGDFMPLACNYSISTDFKTFTFTIINGLKWHDGTPVTIEDFKFTIDCYSDQQSATFVLKNKIESSSVENDSLVITMKSADVRGLNDFTTLRLLPKHIFEGKDIASYEGTDASLGCGPYKFSDFNIDSGTLTFERYEDYFSGKANVKTVIFKFYSNPDTMFLALQNGDIDMVYSYGAGIDSAYIPALKNNSNITLQSVSATNIPSILVFNNSIAPCNNLDFRKAVSYAIDYETAKAVLGSESAVSGNSGIIPNGTLGYKQTDKNERNITKFNEHMTAFGATKAADGYYYKNETKVTLELSVRAGQTKFVRSAEVIANSLNMFGLACSVNALTDAAYWTATGTADPSNGGAVNTPVGQAVVTSMTAAGVNMDYGYATRYLYDETKHQVQSGRITDSAYYTIVDKLKNATSIEEYTLAGHEIQDYYAANVPAVAIYYDGQMNAYNSKLSNFSIDANFGLLNVNTWFNIEAK